MSRRISFDLWRNVRAPLYVCVPPLAPQPISGYRLVQVDRRSQVARRGTRTCTVRSSSYAPVDDGSRGIGGQAKDRRCLSNSYTVHLRVKNTVVLHSRCTNAKATPPATSPPWNPLIGQDALCIEHAQDTGPCIYLPCPEHAVQGLLPWGVMTTLLWILGSGS
jgi:hypothetical protein